MKSWTFCYRQLHVLYANWDSANVQEMLLGVSCDHGKLYEAQGRLNEDGPRVTAVTHRMVDDRKGMAGHLGMRVGSAAAAAQGRADSCC